MLGEPYSTDPFPDSKKTKASIIVLVALILLFAGMSISLMGWYKITRTPSTETSGSYVLGNTRITVPLDPKASAIEQAGISYTFQARIDSVRKVARHPQFTLYELKLTPTRGGQTIPRSFQLLDDTQITSKLTGRTAATYTVKDLKPADIVSLSYYKDLRSANEGQITKVTLLIAK